MGGNHIMSSLFYYSKKDLIIAFSNGYEHGHYDTVEGCFSGNGRPDEHDENAEYWLETALKDGTFKRRLNVGG